jgi:hypothetical protein
MTVKKVIDVKDSGINLRIIDTVDVSEIKDLVNNLTDEEWNENTSRQKDSSKTHFYTRTYFLADCSLDWSEDSPYETVILRPNSAIWNKIKPIVDFLEIYHDGKVGRVIIPRLLSGGVIMGHKDSGYYLESVRRHHIAIQTNEDVTFSVGGEIVNMREGEIWEINNNFVHEVENPSAEDRIHLIIDIIPNQHLAN